jgi:hypothetical protein
MTETSPNRHPLHESIRRHQIRCVAVVDDAFDQVALASFQDGEVREFIDALNEDDKLLRSFHRLASGTESEELLSPADLTDQVVALLWERRGTLGPDLKDVLSSTLFRVLERKVSQVELLCSFLKSELGIERVETYGTAAALPGAAFDLAFVDYRFGPSGQVESVERAVRWAKHLYNNGRTFIILMSTELEARGRQEYFREKSDLTRGLFEFLVKEEIEDNGKFCNRLNSFCAGLETRHEIHGFAAAAEAAAAEALTALKHSIQALGIEDYAYLEQISLREDGHPLGDYMLWLFGEYFAHNLAVNGSLQSARKSINGIKYDRFLPLQRPPSVMLAKMYSAAITEPVYEGWGPHPRVVQEENEYRPPAPETGGDSPTTESTPRADATPASGPPRGGAQGAGISPEHAGTAIPSAASMPLYQLGDLLVATKDKPAYLVLSAACDLQFSPGERDCDVEQSILLIPGRFEPLYEHGSGTNAKRTELFELGDERFRIIWQHTRAVALPYHRILPQYKPQGYQRNWRLKLPYALEVQQHFAAQLTRIGVPTPTPVFRERPVEVYGKDANGNVRQLGTVQSGLVVFHHRQQDQFLLTVDCVHKILSYMDGFIAEIESELSDPQGAGAPPATTPVEVAKEPAPAAGAAPAGQKAKTGQQPARDPVKEAETKSRRRRKYLEELKETREVLAHTCIFQDSLHVVPATGMAVPQIDAISPSEKRTRLEVRHADSLTGRLPGNAPIVLTFLLPDFVASLPAPNSGTEIKPLMTIDDVDATTIEERP